MSFPLPSDLLAAALLFLDTEALFSWRVTSRRARRAFATEGHALTHFERLLLSLHASEQELHALSVLHAGGAARPLCPSHPVNAGNVAPRRKVLSIGHKGADGHVKGNTLASFLEAVRLGADVIEFDVLTCADGAVICHHDPIEEESGVWYEALSLGEARRRLPKLCTLEEMLRCHALADSGIQLYFDLKHTNVVRPTLRLIRRAVAEWGWDAKRFIVASFKQRELLEVNAWRRALPELRGLRTAVILDAVPVALARDFEALGVEAVSVGKFCVFPDFVEDCHRRGLAMWVWTVNSRPLMERLVSQGVDGVCTDFPDMCVAVRDAKAAADAAADAAAAAVAAAPSVSAAVVAFAEATKPPPGPEEMLRMVYHALGGVRDAAVSAIAEARLLAAVAAADMDVKTAIGHSEAAAALAAVHAAAAAAEDAAAFVLQPVVLSAETFAWMGALNTTEAGRALVAGVAAVLARGRHEQPRMLAFERSWLLSSAGALALPLPVQA